MICSVGSIIVFMGEKWTLRFFWHQRCCYVPLHGVRRLKRSKKKNDFSYLMKNSRYMLVGIMMVMLGQVPARGQLSVPLYYGNIQGTVDEFGELLEGTAYNPGDVVQILRADDGVYPPDKNGNPHIFNPVLAEIKVGNGTDPAAGPMGLFAGSVTINRYIQNRLVARVFNGKTRDTSSFYCDSAVFTNSTTSYNVFFIDIASTCVALDANDDDGDKVVNSWERSLGTDSNLADSDGDGFTDGEENILGTSALDSMDFLSMNDLKVATGGGGLEVNWHSVSGKLYQVEYTPNFTAGPASFKSQGQVRANGGNSSMVLAMSDDAPAPAFRVRFIE